MEDEFASEWAKTNYLRNKKNQKLIREGLKVKSYSSSKGNKFSYHSYRGQCDVCQRSAPLTSDHSGRKRMCSNHTTSRLCEHCHEPLNIRNPSGYCDHLYFPENCKICELMGRVKELERKVNSL